MAQRSRQNAAEKILRLILLTLFTILQCIPGSFAIIVPASSSPKPEPTSVQPPASPAQTAAQVPPVQTTASQPPVSNPVQTTQPAQTPSSLDTPSPLSAAALSDAVIADLHYFNANDLSKSVDPESGYPREGLHQLDYTQPTDIGFYAMFLSEIVSGKIQSPVMNAAQAKEGLIKLSASLIKDQTSSGYKGLLPWLEFSGSDRKPWARSVFGDQVSLGDNVNLAASLGAVIGALGSSNDADLVLVRQNLEKFLDNQKEGYQFLWDSQQGKFRRGYNVVTQQYIPGYHDNLNDEFRAGILFIILRYYFPDAAYQNLTAQIKHYVTSDGKTLDTLAGYDGGAFQVLWPSLLMPEADYPAMKQLLTNYVLTALDFSKRNALPGFNSASYTTSQQYCGNCGITALATDEHLFDGAGPAQRVENVASLYTLGAAHPFAPQEIDQFLNEILAAHPELVTDHGLLEGLNKGTGGQYFLIPEQVSANVLTFLLGMNGHGADAMKAYLESKTLAGETKPLYARYLTLQGHGSVQDFGREKMRFIFGTPQYQGILFDGFKADLSGQKLHIVYSSPSSIQDAKLELKVLAPDGSGIVKVNADGIKFEQTAPGQTKEILIDLPATSGLNGIQQLVLSALGTWPDGLKIEKFESVTAAASNFSPSNLLTSDLEGLPTTRIGNLDFPQPTPVYATGANVDVHATEFGMHFNATTGTVGWAGAGFTFDDFGGAPIQTADLSARRNFTFGIQGAAADLKAEFIDAWGNKKAVYLHGISAQKEQVYSIPAESLAGMDLSKMRIIYFILEGTNKAAAFDINFKAHPDPAEAQRLPQPYRASAVLLNTLNGYPGHEIKLELYSYKNPQGADQIILFEPSTQSLRILTVPGIISRDQFKSVSPDGKRLIAVNSQDDIYEIPLAAGGELKTLKLPSSASNSHIASVRYLSDTQIEVALQDNRKITIDLVPPAPGFTPTAGNPNVSWKVVLENEGTASEVFKLLINRGGNIETAATLAKAGNEGKFLNFVDVSPDGNFIVFGSRIENNESVTVHILDKKKGTHSKLNFPNVYDASDADKILQSVSFQRDRLVMIAQSRDRMGTVVKRQLQFFPGSGNSTETYLSFLRVGASLRVNDETHLAVYVPAFAGISKASVYDISSGIGSPKYLMSIDPPSSVRNTDITNADTLFYKTSGGERLVALGVSAAKTAFTYLVNPDRKTKLTLPAAGSFTRSGDRLIYTYLDALTGQQKQITIQMFSLGLVGIV